MTQAHSICKKAFIAIEAVLYIACRVTADPVRSREICQYQGVSVRYLEHMLQKLVHDGVLKGVRGPKGGYVLARERRKIRLSDIYLSIEALEQQDKEELPPSALQLHIMKPMCDELRGQALHKMEGLTISDLCDAVKAKGITIEGKRKGDFSI